MRKSDNSDMKFKDSDNLRRRGHAMAAWTEPKAMVDGLKMIAVGMFTGTALATVWSLFSSGFLF